MLNKKFLEESAKFIEKEMSTDENKGYALFAITQFLKWFNKRYYLIARTPSATKLLKESGLYKKGA